MCHQQKALLWMSFHQSNHLCKLGKTAALELSHGGTPALISPHSDYCQFRTTLWNLFDRKFLISSNKSPEIPKDLILNIESGNQILSNALDISKNTACTSFGGSHPKYEKISWFIDKSWFTQELNGRKTDWLWLSSSFSSLYLKRELKLVIQYIYLFFNICIGKQYIQINHV